MRCALFALIPLCRFRVSPARALLLCLFALGAGRERASERSLLFVYPKHIINIYVHMYGTTFVYNMYTQHRHKHTRTNDLTNHRMTPPPPPRPVHRRRAWFVAGLGLRIKGLQIQICFMYYSVYYNTENACCECVSRCRRRRRACRVSSRVRVFCGVRFAKDVLCGRHICSGRSSRENQTHSTAAKQTRASKPRVCTCYRHAIKFACFMNV